MLLGRQEVKSNIEELHGLEESTSATPDDEREPRALSVPEEPFTTTGVIDTGMDSREDP